MSEIELPNQPGIYSIRCVITGRYYVGSSALMRKRCWAHRRWLRKGKHQSSLLQRAWDKYGEDAFVFALLETISDLDQIFTREQFWIDRLRAHVRQGGFNSYPVAGSPLGFKQTPETRARMSAAKKGDWKMADAHKLAVSIAARETNARRKGCPHGPMPDEHKLAISTGLQGKMTGARPWRRGKKNKMSDDGRAAMAAANARRRGRMSEEHRAAVVAANHRRKGEKRGSASV